MKAIQFSLLACSIMLMSFSVPSLKSGIGKFATSPIVWKSEVIDLGEISQNQPKTINFEFMNTGKTVVVITNVKASCGCTATDYTKTPVQPNATAKVTVSYNAAAKGPFSKSITVTTNAEETPKVLTIKGTVL